MPDRHAVARRDRFGGKIPAPALCVAAFGLILIVLVWGLTAAQARRELDEAIANEFTKNANMAVAFEAHAVRLLQETDQLALLVKDEYEHPGPKPDLKRWVGTGVIKKSTFSYAGIIDERGDVIAAGVDYTPVNLADREFFRFHQVSRTDALRVGEPVLGRTTGRWGIPMTRRLDRPDGSFAGVVDIVLDAGLLTAFYKGLVLEPADSLTLLRNDGLVLGRRARGQSTFGLNLAASPLMARQRANPVGQYLGRSGVDGELRFFSYRSLNDYGLVTVVATGEEQVLAPVHRRAARNYAACAAATLVILAFCSLIVLALMRQKRTADALRASEHGLSTTLLSIGDGVIAVDLGGRITRMNRAAERLTDWPLGDAVGKPLGDVFHVVHAQTRAAVADLVQQALATGQTTGIAGKTVLLARNGEEYQIADSAAPIRTEDGAVTGAVLVFSDVSAKMRGDAQRESLEAQLRESQKMEAIGTLAGGVAHDFNNIIAIILGNIQIAREDAGTNSLVQRSLAEIQKAAVRARDLVRQILSFSRRQPTERKPIALSRVIEESARLLRATLPARLTLEVEIGANVPPVLADFSQMQQVIINLATNSMQAMNSSPGRIGIRLDTAGPDAAGAAANPALAAMLSRTPGRVARLTVSDTGTGMDKETMDRLFEPFFTTKPEGEGTGLGLSVVHGIIVAHEGQILVESQPGKGTSFTLYFPPAQARDAADAAPPGQPAPGAGAMPSRARILRLLYIDDDEALVSLMQRLLGRRGFRISAYADAEEALAALRADPAAFDLVVSDYNMPGMSGLDVAGAVRAIRPDLPVAVASGFISEELRAQAAAAGVLELVFKATSVQDLCESFERLAKTVGTHPPD